MSYEILERVLNSPYKAGVDDIINAQHILSSLGPHTIVNGQNIWFFLAAWDSLDWFYFEVALRKGSEDKCGVEHWLSQVYELDIEHQPNEQGITPANISRHNKDWPFLHNWWQNKRSELENLHLKNKHHPENINLLDDAL